MSNNYVQVPPNSTGVKLQTFENTIGSNVVDAEAVSLVDTDGVSILGTAGSANADVLTIQGISGGTAVPISGSVTASGTMTAEIVGHAGATLDGTAGAPSTGVLTVQGVGSGTAIPVSGTIAATESGAWNINQTLATPGFEAITDGTNGPTAVKAASTAAVATDKALVVAVSPNNTPVLPSGASTATNQVLPYAQGSTTSGQTGPLIQAVALNNPPSYSSGQTNPISMGTNGGLFVTCLTSGSALADNQSNTARFFQVGSPVSDNIPVCNTAYGGAFSGTADAVRQAWSKTRTPTVFKSVQATAAGNTAVWTPGTGNKFRLLGFSIDLTDNAAMVTGSGIITVSFQDATTSIPLAYDIVIPATAITTPFGDGFSKVIQLGSFGILSAAANNVLNFNIAGGNPLTTGNFRVGAWGTEE